MKTELIRGIRNIKPHQQGAVVTIGNFDGVHRGHQAVLTQTLAAASARHAPAIALIFEPQPFEYFKPSQALPRLSRFREKFIALSQAGIHHVLRLPFNQQIASLSATAFVQQILVEALAIQHIVIGDDFCFGHQRAGDFVLLQTLGQQYGFTVEQTQTFLQQGKRVSSSRIREALASADLQLAEQLLGHPFSLLGKVAQGDKRGRMLGFPTANLHLFRKVTPIKGVFAVKIYGLSPQPLFGVANVGNRPTVDGQGRTLLEVHIFNFNETIYGRYIRVEFIHKLRDEKRYDSFDALKAQILQDSQTAQHYFGIQHE